MRVRRMMVPFLALLALLPAGCGGVAGPAVPAAAAPATASALPAVSASRAQPVVPAVVPDSLKFTGTTLDGKAFDAAKFAGGPVVLWFWAPWCAVCLGQASTVGDLAKQYDGKVAMIGVAGLDQSTNAMNEFVAQGEVGNVTHLNDQAGVVWRKFGIKEQSVFVMIDRSGKVMQNGYQDTVTLGKWVAYLDEH
ncbi:redoxin family protein [Dactylosporangium sp. McL0621]|uniref:redoxin family protein n=1 Tax=Dactylosporangium sp. McL0621 TaxID=3415678 RepID=UPI003CED94C2